MMDEKRPEAGRSSTVVAKIPGNCRLLSVTYDCGGEEEGPTRDILAVLNKHQVKATFFATGKWAETYPLTVKAIVAEGHEIGNHSYSHADFTRLTPAEICTEVLKTEEILIRAAGYDPKPLIRYPLGSYNANVLAVAGLLGYSFSVDWTVDPKDWDHPPAGVIVDRVLAKVEGGAVILLHNHSQPTATASDVLIPELRKRGFTFVTVGKALGISR
jgi:Predicted xylanase/chitin deacetylase